MSRKQTTEELERIRAEFPTTEAQVSAQCLAVFRSLSMSIRLKRQNTGGMHTEGRYVKFGEAGDADFSGRFISGPHKGTSLDVETKRPGEVPNAKQWARITRSCEEGAISLWTCDSAWLLETLHRIIHGATPVWHDRHTLELVEPDGSTSFTSPTGRKSRPKSGSCAASNAAGSARPSKPAEHGCSPGGKTPGRSRPRSSS